MRVRQWPEHQGWSQIGCNSSRVPHNLRYTNQPHQHTLPLYRGCLCFGLGWLLRHANSEDGPSLMSTYVKKFQITQRGCQGIWRRSMVSSTSMLEHTRTCHLYAWTWSMACNYQDKNAKIQILWVQGADSDEGMATCLKVDCSSMPTGERGTHWSTR